jgi:hypothetical protein
MSFWTARDLARDLGYPGDTPAFRQWCRSVGLAPIPGSPYCFAVEDVRRVLRRAP